MSDIQLVKLLEKLSLANRAIEVLVSNRLSTGKLTMQQGQWASTMAMTLKDIIEELLAIPDTEENGDTA